MSEEIKSQPEVREELTEVGIASAINRAFLAYMGDHTETSFGIYSGKVANGIYALHKSALQKEREEKEALKKEVKRFNDGFKTWELAMRSQLESIDQLKNKNSELQSEVDRLKKGLEDVYEHSFDSSETIESIVREVLKPEETKEDNL